MKLFALCENPRRKKKGTRAFTSQLSRPIVCFGGAARRLSNTILAFIFVSCSRDFLSLSLCRHLVLWTRGSGAPLRRKEDEILACGERREQEVQTDRKERQEEKVCARERRAHVHSHTCGINHHRPKDNRKWQSPQSAKSSRCFLSLFCNCTEC